MVGPRTFGAVLYKHGCRDVVMQKRLFAQFCDPEFEDRLNFRHFVRSFCGKNSRQSPHPPPHRQHTHSGCDALLLRRVSDARSSRPGGVARRQARATF
eukprot:4147969-Prymnesium_polylepis.1